MKKKWLVLFILTALSSGSWVVMGHTIAEKKASFEHSDRDFDPEKEAELTLVNEILAEKRHYLKALYEKARTLYLCKADPESYYQLLGEINQVRREIAETEQMWRDETATLLSHENYSLWHEPDATLLQLVMDYGAMEYVYLIPPEIGSLRLSINSNLPIPRESWTECLELILAGQGIGIRELNPYLRELFFLNNSLSSLRGITDSVEEMSSFPPSSRICYILSPSGPNPRAALHFLQKFSNPNSTAIQLIGGQIFIISDVNTIHELLKLYEFVRKGPGGQDFQLVSLSKIDAREMVAILESAFSLSSRGNNEGGEFNLRVLPLSTLGQSLFLFGTKEEVTKALKLIRDVESQVEDPREKTVFWYTVKHSDAEDLAKVLARVYDLLIGGKSSLSAGEVAKAAEEAKKGSSLVVKPAVISPGTERTAHRTSDGQNNFIVDAKTGSIIMVVEQEALPKIKEILKKLDVPKKMVQIEVLLFEKKVSNKNKSGLNLLRIGNSASNKHSEGFSWNSVGKGIMEFLISRTKGSGIPAYDLAYNFLIGQEDVHINASPSVTTVNQTPATIAIVEEISINTGTATDSKKDAFSRAQYGITIQITPTINSSDESESETGFVTLETDITFDTTKSGNSDRPDVTRRHIKNHVRIADGQTVILGGLRRKNTEDTKESIPFLGEIPGIGKLFSTQDLSDSNTEMFVFITPKIIVDPIEDAEQIKQEELRKRPGDIPEFLYKLVDARNRERKKLFQGGLTALFGRPRDTFTPHEQQTGEYDGR